MTSSLVFVVPALLVAAAAAVLFLAGRFVPSTSRRLRARRAEQPLAHELPSWSLFEDQGLGIAVNVDLTYRSRVARS